MLQTGFIENKKPQIEKYKLLILILFLFGNYWIWKIISYDNRAGILVILSTIFLFLWYNKRSWNYVFIVSLIALMVSQLKTNDSPKLTFFQNDQVVVRSQRLPYYRVGDSITKRGLGYVFETRNEVQTTNKILSNISEVIDPNLYFFANHPRERGGVKEFHKFPFVFVFFFLFGLMIVASGRTERNKLLTMLIIIFYYGLFDSNTELGPILLFPFIVYFLTRGGIYAYEKLNLLKTKGS